MAHMVDISQKADVVRRAVARGDLVVRASTLQAIREGTVSKGDPIRTAEVAALHAVKKVWDALPYCHPIPITGATAHFSMGEDRVTVTCEVRATYKTGVEMEALYGCAVALLTVWDMVKPLEKDGAGQYPETRIENLGVVEKEKDDG